MNCLRNTGRWSRTPAAMLVLLIASGCSQTNVTDPAPKPHADFVATPIAGEAPLLVTFRNLSSDYETAEWNFGDGGASSAQDAQHQYEGPGTYTVSLTVRGAGGADERVLENYITVSSESKVVSSSPPATPSCRPGLVAGDCWFEGAGPAVCVTADLIVRASGSELWLVLTMTAVGIPPDDTRGYGERECHVYTAEPGWRITEVMSQSSVVIEYVDDDITTDVFEYEMGRFKVKGQTLGMDLCGLETSIVDTELGTITLRLSR